MTNDETHQLTRVATMVEDMHVRLFGNGQPGELAKLGVRMDKMDTDIDELKETRAHAKGFVWAIGTLFTALGGTEIWHLFRK